MFTRDADVCEQNFNFDDTYSSFLVDRKQKLIENIIICRLCGVRMLHVILELKVAQHLDYAINNENRNYSMELTSAFNYTGI